MNHSLSIIIPVYNEATTFPGIWKTLQKVAWPIPVEFIVIDDGSTDGSWKAIRSLHPEKILLKDRNEGKTAAILSGIRLSKGTIICVQDADLEYDPNDILRVIQPIIDDKADVVYGSRFKESGVQVQRTYHRLGIYLLTCFSNLVTGIHLTDLEGCYKAWHSDLIKNITVTSRGFDFDPEVTAKIAKLRVRIQEVPISYWPRAYVEGKKIRYRDGFSAGWTLIKSRFASFEKSFKPELPTKYRNV